MKKIWTLLATSILLIISGCSGSDTYRGTWKAMTPDGEKIEIVFMAKNFTVTDSRHQSKTFGYTQNAVKIVNFIKTYGIKIDDGRAYQINFPIAHNESVGRILDESDNLLYTISRSNYITNEDIFKLK